ncbi:MAG: murein DD-endopeptidase MepM/ murein hydrolase activator NlpD [Saprospiraceae bacterium]|jgi:murein DD-endopeptidase MepM/ murein hydrolase activator NlpD
MGKLVSLAIIISTFFYFQFSNNQEEIVRPEKATPKAITVALNSDPDSLNKAQFFPAISPDKYDDLFKPNPDYFSEGFDYPVGKPDAKKYYKALNFGQKHHLGEDWNGNGGGNTDLGDPVYTVGNGLVVYAADICCGWGNTVRIVHFLPNHSEYKYVESIYSHLHNVHVKVGDFLHRGDQIGTIGNANGRYSAHLHLEFRDFVNMSMGPGYSSDQFGYLNPTDFIEGNRPVSGVRGETGVRGEGGTKK